MEDRPPTSVLLPTVRETAVVDEVADQLRGDDELVAICDDEDDPVALAADADGLPPGTRLVVAGEPEGCSGKANAIAAGTEAAEHERLVWTDDDFSHPPDWLAMLQADYERQGPTSELPFFRGTDPLAVLLEPLYFVAGSVSVSVLDKAWGGGVIFERSDLDAECAGRPLPDVDGATVPNVDADSSTDDEAAFLRDLQRSISDDGLLAEYLELTAVRRSRRVDVGGGVRETLERHVRWSKVVRVHGGEVTAPVGVAATLLAVGLVLQPVLVGLALTLLCGLAYLAFGIDRWTFVLAGPALLASVPLGIYERTRETFVWAGRRYRWSGTFDVEVLGEA